MPLANWFRKESNGHECDLLSPVKEVLPDRESWAKEIIKDTGVSVNVTALYLITKEDLEEESATVELATLAVEEANTEKTRWGTRRKQGSRQIGSTIQRFAKNFSAFLESYSGIVEMVKTGDNQYGGLAYGTLSLLLSVAVMKQQYEEKIDSFLEQLAREFPRLEILDDVFPSTKIQTLVASIYQEGIRFARECTVYYSRSSAGRVGHAAKSPLNPVEIVVSRMQDQLVEVRRESEALLQKRIRDVLSINTRMAKEIEGLRNQMNAMQANEDRERLDKLRIALNLQTPNAGNLDIDRYRSLLDNDYPQGPSTYSHPTRLTRTQLEREEAFQHWDQTDGSCLLHLSGQNWSGSDSSSTLLWLSTAATLIIMEAQSSNAVLAYYLCQVNYHVRKPERSYIQTLAASMVLQLVAHRPAVLRNGELSRSITATIDEKYAKVEDEDMALEKMKECILKVLDYFEDDDVVVLILDRPDKCHCGRDEVSAIDTLKSLLQIALDGRCQMKILVIARSSWLGARQTEKLETWLRKEQRLGSPRAQGLRYLHRQNWNQESERERSLSPDWT